MEEHVVDDAENDRASADAESQGADGDEGETTTFAKVAEGVAEVTGEILEVGFHASKLYTEAAVNCTDLTAVDISGSFFVGLLPVFPFSTFAFSSARP